MATKKMVTDVDLDAAVQAEINDTGSLSRGALNATIDARAVKVSEAPLDPRRYGATFDGVTDDTTALRDAFAALPASGGTIALRGGKAVTKRILLNGKTNTTVIFDQAELVASAAAPDTGAGDAGVALTIANCTDLDLRNVHINGNRANIASQASGSTNRGVQVALKISSSTRVQVNNPRILEAVQDGIAGSTNKQVTITNPVMENIGESGIYFSTGSEDIAIIGGTFKNTGASGDWGNVVQFRNDCQRISIVGLVSKKSYGGITFTEGITDASVVGFVGHEMGIPVAINSAGTLNPVNKRIKITGSEFYASATPRAAASSTVDDFHILGTDFYGAFIALGSFDTFVDSTVDGFNPGAGLAALNLKAKARVLGSTVRNITGRGIEVQGAGAAVFDTRFDTLSDLAIRILAAGTTFRHGRNRFTGVTGGPLFDSTTDSLGGDLFRPAVAASALGALSKKQEIFDDNGVSLGFIPIYTSIT